MSHIGESKDEERSNAKAHLVKVRFCYYNVEHDRKDFEYV